MFSCWLVGNNRTFQKNCITGTTLTNPWMTILKSSLTELVLHHPDLQLDEAVGVKAVILSHAAVADFMATQIELALRT